MEMTFQCPRCQSTGRVADFECKELAHCDCDMNRPLTRSAIENCSLVACPWCGCEDLYAQKDFPHILGLGIVVFGFVASTIFWYFYMPISALTVLLGTALLDLALYYLVPDVTICYRCLSQYRGPGTNLGERFHPFDLSIGERYRQERLRAAELRQRGQTV